MEELDYFDDKKIVFRAVKESDPDAKGSDLCPLSMLEPGVAKVSTA